MSSEQCPQCRLFNDYCPECGRGGIPGRTRSVHVFEGEPLTEREMRLAETIMTWSQSSLESYLSSRVIELLPAFRQASDGTWELLQELRHLEHLLQSLEHLPEDLRGLVKKPVHEETEDQP
jgi:hypothetical protein